MTEKKKRLRCDTMLAMLAREHPTSVKGGMPETNYTGIFFPKGS